jgi:DNA-binding NtrC family response regulator
MTHSNRHRKPTVLLVDDDERVLGTLQDLVRGLGYDTATANTGVAGLAIVKAEAPDAVLLDIAMPGALDGVTTLQAIKACRPDLPVIMVTANIDDAVARATLREGAFDYMMKPIELTRLGEILSAAVTLAAKPA